MDIVIQVDQEKLAELVGATLERNILSNSLGLGGLIPNVPFFTNLGDIGAAVQTAVVMDRVRLLGTSIERSRSLQRTPLEIPPRTTRPSRSDPATTIQLMARATIVLPVFEVFLVTQNDLAENNGDPVPDARTMRVQVRVTAKIPPLSLAGDTLAIQAQITGAEVGMGGLFVGLPASAELADLERQGQLELFRDRNPLLAGVPPERLSGLFDFMVLINSSSVLGSITIPPLPLNLSGIHSLLRSFASDTPYELFNAGLAVNMEGQVVVRLQYEPSDTVITHLVAGLWQLDWIDFYERGRPSRVGEDDWGFFLPHYLFMDSLDNMIVEGVESSSQIFMSAGSRPRSTWSVLDGDEESGECRANARIQVVTRFAVFVPDSCEPWGFGVDVNVQLTTVLSVSGDKLRADVKLDFSPDDGDVIGCGFANAFLLAGAGIAIGGLFGPIGAAIGGVIAGLGAGIATAVVGYTYDPGSLPLGEIQPVPGREHEYFIEYPIDTDLALSGARMTLTGLAGCTDGLTARGALSVSHGSLLSAGPMRGPVDEFDRRGNTFRWSGLSCSTEVRASMVLEWELRHERAGSSPFPLVVFEVRVLNTLPPEWRHLIFLSTRLYRSGGGVALELNIAVSRALFSTSVLSAAETPVLQLLILTNLGARIVRTRAFDGSLTNETLDLVRARSEAFCAWIEMGGRARERARPFPDLFFRQLAPLVIVSPWTHRNLSLWAVAASGLNQGHAVHVTRQSQTARVALTGAVARSKGSEERTFPVTNFVPSENGIAFGYLSEQLPRERSALMLHVAGGSEATRLSMVHHTLFEIARLPMAGPLRSIAYDQKRQQRRLALLSDAGLDVYVLETDAVRLEFAQRLPGMRELRWKRGRCCVEDDHMAYEYHPQRACCEACPTDSRKLENLPRGTTSTIENRVKNGIDEDGRQFSMLALGEHYAIWKPQESSVSIYRLVETSRPDPLPQTDQHSDPC